MRRRLLDLLTALSLLLCAGVCVLWVRSFWRSDAVLTAWPADATGFDSASRSLHAYSACGGIMLTTWDTRWRGHDLFTRYDSRRTAYWSEEDPEAPWSPPTAGETRPVFVNLFGFGVARRQIANIPIGPGMERMASSWISGYCVWVPHWAAVLLAAVLPARAAMRGRRRQRAAAGLFCPDCGYDLRATPGRCPECGTENRAVIPN